MSTPSELRAPTEDAHAQPNFFDTQELRTLKGDNVTATELLVLSRDADLIEVVQKAAPSVVRVIDAANLEEVAEQPGLNPGVLIVDTCITNDVHALLPQLLQHFPEIVTIVVGKRDDISALMRLTASGRIFRFLVLPLAHGQTRLALTSAVAHHLEIKAANVRTGAVPVMPVKRSSAAYIALGAGLLVAIAAIWIGIGAFTRREPAATAVQAAPAPSASMAIASQPTAAETTLQLAKDAFEQGAYIEPKGNSALDLYRKTLELDPTNLAAQNGIREVADKVLGNAERALTAQRLPEAIEGIETARRIDAANPRLQFLDVQVSRERERLKLDEERDRATRVRRLVQQASTDIAAQRYLRPAGSNARDALLEARKLDPSDPAIALATTQLTSAMMDASRRAAGAGDMKQAKELLDAARKLGASEVAVAAVERSWNESARSKEAATNRAAPLPDRTPPGTADKPVTTEPATAALTTRDAASTQSPATITTPPAASSRPDQWLQAIDLPRTREVAPDYPTQAAINGIEGWVDVDFTISPEGTPENLRVRDSSPRRTFDRAALDSVRQWRFVPIEENGMPVARRATLRVRFSRQ